MFGKKLVSRKKAVSFCTFMIMLSLIGCSHLEEKLVDNSEKKSLNETIILPDGSIVNPDGNMKLAEGSVSYGLFDVDGKLVQSGDTILVKDELVKGTVNFQQNIPGKEIEYTLIMLVDYVQRQFLVKKESCLNYLFSLKGEDSMEVEIELPLPAEAETLTFLIIPEPNVLNLDFDTEEGRNNLFQTHNYYTITCCLNSCGNDEKELNFSEELIAYDENTTSLFMTKDLKVHKIMSECNSREKVKILIGNTTEYKKTYIMLAFLNWEQVMINREPYQLFEVEADRGYYYELEVPDVEKESPYQIFMIENPFNPSLGDWNLSTMRTIIKP